VCRARRAEGCCIAIHENFFMALMLDRRNQIEEEEEEELWEDADTLCTVTIKSTQKP